MPRRTYTCNASHISLNSSVASLPFLISFTAIPYHHNCLSSSCSLIQKPRTLSETHLQELLISSHHHLCSHLLLSWIDLFCFFLFYRILYLVFTPGRPRDHMYPNHMKYLFKCASWVSVSLYSIYYYI